MNISEGFIKRPIATSLLMAAIALFGLVAYRSLPVSDLPNVDFPTLLVTAQLPGASPETMGASVATPLENQFSMIAGLESMTSVNSLGSTQITLEFDLNRSLDGAAVDVQGAITQAARLLPQGMPTPPTFTKVNPADQPILYLVITSTTVPPWTLDEYAETRIAQRISMVSGVAQVQVLGSQKFAVHAQLDPHALAARQIGINEVEAALRDWNVNTPTGSIIGPHKTYTLQATGQLMTAAEYKDMIVAYRNGAPVRLGELGNIKDGVEDERTASWFYTADGAQRAITLGIQRQPGTNTIAVADAVKALMPQWKLELPSSIHMDVLYDRSDTIRESYRDVQFTMLLTLALVIMVIFVFLRNVWATVIPSLALPFSIIGTFAVMYMLGYSLDNLSMMALILSVGFVVDDAIVMLENIYRHVEMGEDPLTASLVGSREIGFTIVSMTLSLAAVFIPVLFMGGVLGRLFREFSVTICVAILISGVVSVTLTPMLCSLFLKKPHEHGEESKFGKVTEAGLRQHAARLRQGAADRAAPPAGDDGGVRRGAGPHRRAVRAGAERLHPRAGHRSDRGHHRSGAGHVVRQAGRIPGQGRRTSSARIRTSKAWSRPSAAAPRRRSAGPTSARSSSTSSRAAIARSWPTDIIAKLRPQIAKIVGMDVYMQNPPTVRIGGQVSKSLYQFSMQSPNRERALRGVAQSEEGADRPARHRGSDERPRDLQPAGQRRDRSRQGGGARRHRQPDRERVLRRLRPALGLDDLRAGQRVQGAARARARVPERSRGAVAALLQGDAAAGRRRDQPRRRRGDHDRGARRRHARRARSAARSASAGNATAGTVVPLDTLAKTTQVVGPQTVNHHGQLPAVTISFGLAPGASLGDVLTRVQKVADETLPDTVSGAFQGAAKAFESSLGNLAVLLSSRSWSSTSCSASSTRATSTR